MEHYGGILGGYAVAVGLFWGVLLATGGRGLTTPAFQPSRPGIEVALGVLAIFFVIAIGQIYIRGWLFEDRGEVLRSLNQLLIFAPVLTLAVIRGNGREALFIPKGVGLPVSLALGCALALCAVIAYAGVRGLAGEWREIAAHLTRASNTSLAVQVLLEDLAIAFLLARLRAVMGVWWSIALVAALFQIAHIPAFLANGATLETLSSLLFDTAIGLAVFGALLRSRNVLWFWPIHVVLDLMQFY